MTTCRISRHSTSIRIILQLNIPRFSPSRSPTISHIPRRRTRSHIPPCQQNTMINTPLTILTQHHSTSIRHPLRSIQTYRQRRISIQPIQHPRFISSSNPRPRYNRCCITPFIVSTTFYMSCIRITIQTILTSLRLNIFPCLIGPSSIASIRGWSITI